MPSNGSWLTVVDNMAYQGVSVMNRMHMTQGKKVQYTLFHIQENFGNQYRELLKFRCLNFSFLLGDNYCIYFILKIQF
jgi:hypothetical protein